MLCSDDGSEVRCEWGLPSLGRGQAENEERSRACPGLNCKGFSIVVGTNKKFRH